ncbi:hypothetical protein BH11BAC4_BH11BAC4_06120 [soil metagenome]
MFAATITRSFFFSIVFFISYDGVSQKATLPKWEAGINAGAYIYQGDLTIHPIGSVETIRPGFGLSVTRIISSAFSARLMFNMAKIAADESIYNTPKFRQHRNLAFNASVKELGLSVHWNVFGTNYDNVKFQPYVFAGAGVSFVNITRDYSGFNMAYFGPESSVTRGLATDVATAPPKVIAVIPVGGGIRYNISDRLVANIEGTYRLMRTDYLDGFSQAANPNMKDHYSSLTIGIAYKFGSRDRYGCPTAN